MPFGLRGPACSGTFPIACLWHGFWRPLSSSRFPFHPPGGFHDPCCHHPRGGWVPCPDPARRHDLPEASRSHRRQGFGPGRLGDVGVLGHRPADLAMGERVVVAGSSLGKGKTLSHIGVVIFTLLTRYFGVDSSGTFGESGVFVCRSGVGSHLSRGTCPVSMLVSHLNLRTSPEPPRGQPLVERVKHQVQELLHCPARLRHVHNVGSRLGLLAHPLELVRGVKAPSEFPRLTKEGEQSRGFLVPPLHNLGVLLAPTGPASSQVLF